MTIRVTLQYFDGCPNWREAEADLTQAIDGVGADVDIAYEKIESIQQAETAAFRGSPTILVSGRDPFADNDAPIGLTCRIYRTGDRTSGSPGVEALRAALEQFSS